MDDLYREDIYAWSKRQAAVLRSLADRRDLPNELDLANVVEEIEEVGDLKIGAVNSAIRLIMVHLIKIASVPGADPVQHWQAEIATFHADALQDYTRSMAQNIDLPLLWRRARRQAEASLAAYHQSMTPGLPDECPFELPLFLQEDFDLSAALALLRAGPPDHH